MLQHMRHLQTSQPRAWWHCAQTKLPPHLDQHSQSTEHRQPCTWSYCAQTRLTPHSDQRWESTEQWQHSGPLLPLESRDAHSAARGACPASCLGGTLLCLWHRLHCLESLPAFTTAATTRPWPWTHHNSSINQHLHLKACLHSPLLQCHGQDHEHITTPQNKQCLHLNALRCCTAKMD